MRRTQELPPRRGARPETWQATTQSTEVRLLNPPGQPSLHYRIGDYLSFLTDMVARLRNQTIPDGDFRGTRPLARIDLSQRHNWVMGLLGAWAAVGDVLTFYQERIANEGYLRTAVEDASVRELVLSIDYRPNPAVAGSTYLAFTVADSKEMPASIPIPLGCRVLSLPLSDKLPQTFETSEPLTAYSALNAVRPLAPSTKREQTIDGATTSVRVTGTPLGATPGVPLLLMDGGAAGEEPEARRFLRFIQTTKTETGTTPGTLTTVVAWDGALAVDRPLAEPQVLLLRQRANLFGHNATAWADLPEATKRQQQPVLGGVRLSTDGGESFTSANQGLPSAPVRALAAGPDGTLYIALAGLGVFRSLDGGGSWQIANQGLTQPDVYSLIADAGGYVFVGTATGVFRSTDRAGTWDPVGADAVASGSRGLFTSRKKTYARLPETTVRALACVAEGETTLLYAGTDLGIFRCDVAGGAWEAVNRGLPGRNAKTGLAKVVVHDLAIGAASGEVYAATERGVFRTTKRGRRWRAINQGLPGRRPWSRLTSTPATAIVFLADRRTAQQLLLAGTTAGVYRSTDLGRSWKPASLGLPATDPDSGASATAVTRLAAATDPATLLTSVYAATASGPYLSLDGGTSWTPLATGTPDPTVEAVAVGPGGELAVATPFDGYAEEEWPGLSIERGRIDLDSVVVGVVGGGWVALYQPQEDGPPKTGIFRVRRGETVRREDYGLAATVTRIEVDPKAALAAFDLRHTLAFCVSEELDLAVEEAPAAPLSGGRFLVGRALPEEIAAGRRVILAGKLLRAAGGTANGSGGRAGASQAGGAAWLPAGNDDTIVAELTTAEQIVGAEAVAAAVAAGVAPEGTTLLALDPPPAAPYDPSTVTIFGNVAYATQGETAPDEVLGSGDATRTNQYFTLKKPPLTWVRDRLTGKVRSTLEVRVDGTLWREVESLFDAGASEHVYMLRPDLKGNTTVFFGDGLHGARLPSGTENVWAYYRSGTWTDPVGAGQISLLQSRPFALRGAANPMPASPGSPPEPMSQARVRAPLAVRTLGRIVSLQDYEDFARTYPGVDKARAVGLWTSDARLAQITIAASGGRAVTADDGLYQGLVRAIQTAGSPSRQVRVDSYRRVAFRLEATITIDPDHAAELVLAGLRQALDDAFSFARARFGQTIAASEVIAVLQQEPGVVAVDLDAFYSAGEDPELRLRLEARPARLDPSTGAVLPAELLVLDAPNGALLRA